MRKLQQEGQRVAFVGDGINDAPALEQADLGVAVSRASDIAREAADIILLRSEIEAVPESLGLARATLRTIHQNLFWAFFYNAIGVPLAALGFMSPILCAAAMGLSDLVVIGNALRLRRWRAALKRRSLGSPICCGFRISVFLRASAFGFRISPAKPSPVRGLSPPAYCRAEGFAGDGPLAAWPCAARARVAAAASPMRRIAGVAQA